MAKVIIFAYYFVILHSLLGLFMKKESFIKVFTATLLLMASIPAFAQEENGFKKFNVREDFTENGFQWFHDAELLAAGDKEKSNAMTIGWGGIGTLWGRTALTVYVAEKRYTKEFMDKAEYFTVMAFDVKDSKVRQFSRWYSLNVYW